MVVRNCLISHIGYGLVAAGLNIRRFESDNKQTTRRSEWVKIIQFVWSDPGKSPGPFCRDAGSETSTHRVEVGRLRRVWSL